MALTLRSLSTSISPSVQRSLSQKKTQELLSTRLWSGDGGTTCRLLDHPSTSWEVHLQWSKEEQTQRKLGMSQNWISFHSLLFGQKFKNMPDIPKNHVSGYGWFLNRLLFPFLTPQNTLNKYWRRIIQTQNKHFLAALWHCKLIQINSWCLLI